MKDKTKIQLSAQERDLVTNTEWILTKHRIVKKVYEIFGEINEMMKLELIHYGHLFPENLKYQGSKISKGDNYQLLPYVILDYPSFFGKNNICAVRTMFWWGNFFSVTLHLSGDHKAKYINNSPALFSFLKQNNFSICVSEEEWQHHFGEDNYVSFQALTNPDYQHIIDRSFFKVAKKLSLKQWDDAPDFIMRTFSELLQLLQINFPGDKKDLLPGSPIIGSDL